MEYTCIRCHNKREDYEIRNGVRLKTCNRCRNDKARYLKTENGKINNYNSFKKYLKTEKGKYKNNLRRKRKYKENPDKEIARSTVHYYKKIGKLIKENCKICGEENTEGHHKDYKNKLGVIWLCRKHHNLLHQMIKKERQGALYNSKAS